MVCPPTHTYAKQRGRFDFPNSGWPGRTSKGHRVAKVGCYPCPDGGSYRSSTINRPSLKNVQNGHESRQPVSDVVAMHNPPRVTLAPRAGAHMPQSTGSQHWQLPILPELIEICCTTPGNPACDLHTYYLIYWQPLLRSHKAIGYGEDSIHDGCRRRSEHAVNPPV